MRRSHALLSMAAAVLLAVLAAGLWLSLDKASAVPAQDALAPRARLPQTARSTPANEHGERGEHDKHEARSAPEIAHPPAPEEVPPEPSSGSTPFGAWDPARNTPEFEGPVVDTHFSDGTPEYAGTQVLDAQGIWRLEGPWTAWHPNGQVSERGAYRNGLEDGPWEWWYQDGTPLASGNWIEGRRAGRWSFWQPNAALGAVGHYADGEGDGPWTLYHPNGLPWIAGDLLAGRPEGLWQVWNEDGSLDSERTGRFQDGLQVE